MNGTVIWKFVAVLKQQKILGNICFSGQIFYRKQLLGAPARLALENWFTFLRTNATESQSTIIIGSVCCGKFFPLFSFSATLTRYHVFFSFFVSLWYFVIMLLSCMLHNVCKFSCILFSLLSRLFLCRVFLHVYQCLCQQSFFSRFP